MLLAGKTTVGDLSAVDANMIQYCKLDKVDEWKVTLANEIVAAKAKTLEIPGFDAEELDVILEYVCTS